MAISMLIKDKKGDIIDDVPICTYYSLQTYWKPTAERLGLDMINALGALDIDSSNAGRLVHELHSLKAWATSQIDTNTYMCELVDRIDTILSMLKDYDISEYEISFG